MEYDRSSKKYLVQKNQSKTIWEEKMIGKSQG